MRKKRKLDEEIEDFLEFWGADGLYDFMNQLMPLFDMYNVSEDADWLSQLVGKDNVTNIRLIRTAYIMSKIADTNSAKLCTANIKFKNLWLKIEEAAGV